MISTTIYLVMLVLLVSILVSLSSFMSIKMKHDREKYSVFECGFDLMSLLRLPFSLNFYFVTIIFLIFDVEVTMILPFVFNLKFLLIGNTILVLLTFFFVLILGFIYEWLVGLLNWLI